MYPGTQLDGHFVEVKPGKKVQVNANELGDVNNTFLLVKNMSDVNEGAYKVEIPND